MNTKRNLSYDLVRVVGTFLVICIHVSGPGFANIQDPNWWAVNFYDSFARVSVPLFFLLSGALLLNRKESIPQLIQRIFKILLPFVGWSLLYIFKRRRNGDSISYLAFLQGPVTYHLWFCYTLIGAYLFLPVMRAIAQQMSRPHQYILLVYWFLAAAIFPLLEKFFRFKIGIDFSYIQSFLGYFLLGHLLSKVKRLDRSEWIFCASLWGIFSMVTALGTALLSQESGHGEELFYTYLSPAVILGSAFAFLSIQDLGRDLSEPKFRLLRGSIESISQASYGIYLLHPLVLDQLSRKLKVTHVTGSSWFWIPLTSLICLGICWIGIGLIQKIPYLRRLV